MNNKSIDKQLLSSMEKILEKGYKVTDDRTGVGTTKIFGEVIRLQVSEDNLPINKTKTVFFKAIVVELLWMLSGNDNIQYLKDHGIKIWDQWADEDGSLNGVYGKQWREWPNIQLERTYGKYENKGSIDQVSWLIDTIKNNPNDRRQLVSAWNVGRLSEMNLPPCHYMWQTFVRGDTLDLMMHQRSCDMFLGVPFDLTAYSLLLCILSRITGKQPGEFVWTGGDCHIYSNHHEQVAKQIKNYDLMRSEHLFEHTQLVFDEAIDFTSLESFLETNLG